MEEIIKKYLEERAKTDESVAKNLRKVNKSIKECCEYITEEARKLAKNGCAAVEDSVVFGWAVHYYDEDSIKMKKDTKPCKVSTTSADKKGKDEKKQQGKAKTTGKTKVVQMYPNPNADKKGQFLLF